MGSTPSPSSYNRPNPTPYQRTLILRCAVCHGTADGQWLPIAAFPELIQYAPPDQRYTLADLNGAALDHRFQASFDPLLPSGPLAERARLGGSGEVLGTAFSLWADYLFAPLPGSPRSTVGAMTPVIGAARETVAAIQAERYERALFYGGSAILDVFLAKWLANGVVSAWRRAPASNLVTSGRRWRWGYNAIPDSEAAAAYQAIRESTTDVAAIARYTGYKPDRIRRIKDYLFNNPEWTAADAEIAAAWHRLRTGRGTDLDRLLLKHETAEMFLRKRYGLDYWEAHRRANQHWNWERAIMEQGR